MHPSTLASAFTLILSAAAFAAPPIEGTVGPLVGHLTPDTAKLWMFAPHDATVTVTYHPQDDPVAPHTASFEAVEKPAAEKPGRPFFATLTGLAVATTYRYEVTVNGKSWSGWLGSFRTPPTPGTPHKLRLVLTSCMKIGQPTDSWSLLLAEMPELHLTVGDTHYADTTEPSVQWDHHLRYRRDPRFAEVLRKVPTYAMWDDHDYGPNDSDRTAVGKENSLAGWRQIWANPPLGTDDTPGAFHRFRWGEVEFFMVDGRYHRSPDRAPDDDDKRMLGDAQFAWLLDGLKASTAKFKVIASGSTLDHSKSDGWKLYTFARNRLYDAIRDHRLAGVVYMAGDIHRSLAWEATDRARTGYPLVEVISSGVANSETLSFATIDFDTTAADPTMRVRTILGTGDTASDRTWALSALSPPAE